MNKSKPIIHNKGISLIEIMLATILMGVMLVPILNMFSQGTTQTIRSRDELTALGLASNLMSYAYTKPYTDLQATSGPETRNDLTIDYENGSLSLEIDDERYMRTIEVTEVTPTNWRFSYKLVNVIVSWQDPDGNERQVGIAGIISDE